MKVEGLFGRPMKVVAVGIESFSDDLRSQGVPVVQMDWRAPSEEEERNRKLAERLAAMLEGGNR